MTPIDHASDVVSLLATTSTSGAGESPPTKFCVSLAAAAFRIFAASQRDGAYKSLELYLARKINVL